jgi:hypothetical protein
MYIFHVNRFCIVCKPPLHRSNKAQRVTGLRKPRRGRASGLQPESFLEDSVCKLRRNAHPYGIVTEIRALIRTR